MMKVDIDEIPDGKVAVVRKEISGYTLEYQEPREYYDTKEAIKRISNYIDDILSKNKETDKIISGIYTFLDGKKNLLKK